MTGLWEIFERWLVDQKDREFVSQMNAMAVADLGVSRLELQEFMSNRRDTRERLVQMAARFGVTAKEIDAQRWRALELTRECGRCAQEKVCRRFLDEGGDTKAVDRFCPNAAEYRKMAKKAN